MLHPNPAPAEIKIPNLNAKDFYNEAQETFIYLYCRWQDEKEYEDIKDYGIPLQKLADRLEGGVKITKMTKRPFGCHFEVGGRIFEMCITRNRYCYKEIGLAK